MAHDQITKPWIYFLYLLFCAGLLEDGACLPKWTTVLKSSKPAAATIIKPHWNIAYWYTCLFYPQVCPTSWLRFQYASHELEEGVHTKNHRTVSHQGMWRQSKIHQHLLTADSSQSSLNQKHKPTRSFYQCDIWLMTQINNECGLVSVVCLHLRGSFGG